MMDPIAKNRADANLKIREQQKADAPVARAEYEAAGAALRENAARLRALRLAREAEAANQPAPTGKAAKKTAAGQSTARIAKKR